MRNFEISVDSTCDLYAEEYKKMGVHMAPLEYILTSGKEVEAKKDNFQKYDEYVDFYNKMREGVVATTSMLNVESHVEHFTKMIESGVKNALHLSMSVGLSPTSDNAKQAVKLVNEQFEQANFAHVDSNSATIGEGMMVLAAVKMRDEGRTLEDTVLKLKEIRKFTQHFVVVNDLKFLFRGGRLSRSSAILGTMLQIKPIIQFGRDSKLKLCKKELGLKKALKSIVNDFSKFTLNKDFPFTSIVHTDNEPLAKELQNMLFEAHGIRPEIRIMGPVIGAHVGPNSVAFGFLSNQERPFE